jgi:hypothetical protein
LKVFKNYKSSSAGLNNLLVLFDAGWGRAGY